MLPKQITGPLLVDDSAAGSRDKMTLLVQHTFQESGRRKHFAISRRVQRGTKFNLR